MKPAAPLKVLVSVGELLRRRLKETKFSLEDLAAAAEVPPEYVTELISGDRRPPLPGRTDIYERMTRFLSLSRTDLVLCANAERADSRKSTTLPDIAVRRALFAICEPETAKELERRAKKNPAELIDLFQRVLDVAQASVWRTLDPIMLRLTAARNGSEYVPMRLRVLEFLDLTPSALTMADLTNWVLPKIGSWDVDLGTGVLRVVLRSQEAPELSRRRPTSRGR